MENAQQKCLLEELKNLKQKLEEAEKAIQARDELLSIAAHELKTPLTSLLMQHQMLIQLSLKKGDLSLIEGRKRKLLEMSRCQIERISQRVDQLMDVSRLQVGKLQLKRGIHNLSEIVQAVINQFSSSYTKLSNSIDFKGHGHVIGFWDQARIEQVVVNLLMNAIRYGELKPIKVRVFKKGEDAYFIIKDNGIGIKQEDLSRIFDRFQRASKVGNGEGLGLGLYISRKIVEDHGGSISVKSAPGKGSKFIVRLSLNFKNNS